MTDIANAPIASDDDRAIIEAGYKPQLKRSLGFFSSFAVSFSFMSILLGVFSAYGFVLNKAGPFGIWTWPMVGFGQTMVALIFAEMAGRIPLTGALYNWNTRLANPGVGWMTAWILIFVYAVSGSGVVVAMMAPLQTFLGMQFTDNEARAVGVGVILAQTAINIYGVRLAAHANKLAVIAEMIALFIFGSMLLAVILIKGEAHTSLLTTMPDTGSSYLPGFLMASLLAAWTLFGFETPSDLSEETVNARRVTSKSIVSSVLVTAVLGFIFVVILTLAIPDVAAVTASPDPVSMIVAHHLGAAATRVFLVVVLLSMFAATMLNITAASRIIFAIGRDKRIFGSAALTRVSGHNVPTAAIAVVAVLEILAIIFFQNMTDLFAAPTILLTTAYLITVVCFTRGARKLPPTSHFSLGKWHWPVTIMAVVWLISEICILTMPEDFHSAAAIAGAVLAAGAALYFVTGRKNAGPA